MLCRMKRDPNSSDSGARAGLHHAGEEHASPTPLLLHTHTPKHTHTTSLAPAAFCAQLVLVVDGKDENRSTGN